MNPTLRSALRSLLFNVVGPLALVLIANQGAALVGFGLDDKTALVAAEVIGIVVRAYLPNVLGARNPAQ